MNARKAPEVRMVVKGQLATFEAESSVGWIRRPVPADGLLIETSETTTFVPWSDVIKARKAAK